jgi:hypothetical protein
MAEPVKDGAELLRLLRESYSPPEALEPGRKKLAEIYRKEGRKATALEIGKALAAGLRTGEEHGTVKKAIELFQTGEIAERGLKRAINVEELVARGEKLPPDVGPSPVIPLRVPEFGDKPLVAPKPIFGGDEGAFRPFPEVPTLEDMRAAIAEIKRLQDELIAARAKPAEPAKSPEPAAKVEPEKEKPAPMSPKTDKK